MEQNQPLLLKFSGYAFVATLSAASMANAATLVASRSSDNVIQGNFETGAASVFLQNNSNARRVGGGGANGSQRVNNPVLGFTLPAITPGHKVTAANFGLTMDSAATTASPSFDAVISLMNQTSAAGFSGADFTENAGDLGNGTLVSTFSVR